ncbi:hypothetical protein NFI96_004653 [Prochilodus magdalenae]|nr:hypothetical protein NFI96_004653 [Prochilodus magdalenae]
MSEGLPAYRVSRLLICNPTAQSNLSLDKGGCAVRVMFFDFSSAFNTIQPLLLRDKLMKMEVDMHLVTWITDYLTGRPQHVRIRDCSSDTVISSTGAPQGTVLSPVLFTLYTSDFKYNSELCHMQKFSDDTAIVGCVRNGQEREYRSLVEDFVEWCTTNHLKLNITKTKEMCIDFRRSRPSQQPISIKGVDVEVVRSYRYLGVHLDERLDWSVNTDIVYKKAQSRLYFLRRLGSFRICQKLLLMFYQSVVASVLFYAVVCWGGSISKRDAGRLDRLLTVFESGLESFIWTDDFWMPGVCQDNVQTQSSTCFHLYTSVMYLWLFPEPLNVTGFSYRSSSYYSVTRKLNL